MSIQLGALLGQVCNEMWGPRCTKGLYCEGEDVAADGNGICSGKSWNLSFILFYEIRFNVDILSDNFTILEFTFFKHLIGRNDK